MKLIGLEVVEVPLRSQSRRSKLELVFLESTSSQGCAALFKTEITLVDTITISPVASRVMALHLRENRGSKLSAFGTAAGSIIFSLFFL